MNATAILILIIVYIIAAAVCGTLAIVGARYNHQRRRQQRQVARDLEPARPTGGRGRTATDNRRPWWRELDLIHDGRTFLRRRGFDLRHAGGILIHRIDDPDPGLDLHDHPWSFVTVILRGGYTEEVAETRVAAQLAEHAADVEAPRPGDSAIIAGHVTRGNRRTWRRWSIHRMPLTLAHRITAVEPDTVTLVLRRRKVRRWGFYVPRCPAHPGGGWVDWEQYDYATRRPCAAESNVANERRPAP